MTGTPAEKKKLAKEQEIRIAKCIVGHHPNILNEIIRLLKIQGEARP